MSILFLSGYLRKYLHMATNTTDAHMFLPTLPHRALAALAKSNTNTSTLLQHKPLTGCRDYIGSKVLLYRLCAASQVVLVYSSICIL